MLSLKSNSSGRWLDHVDRDLDEILIDHAHCEKKAASCAMNLIFSYVENRRLRDELTLVVKTELEQFQKVLSLLDRRGVEFVRMRPSAYASRLNEVMHQDEPMRAIDRLLVAGLIEMRTCDRFNLLRQHLADKHLEVAEFYNRFCEFEPRHQEVYFGLAKEFGPSELVQQRLHELMETEARIIEQGELAPRMHS